ncbi:MAG: hypothetical protein QNJ11_13860 [Woeseiaceae bacterium]|nr:hypothetical protein [Woeseiaceae bacterium]
MKETTLNNPSLVRDLVRWVAERPRPYHEAINAWRTSCPQLTVWEDAVDAGFVRVGFEPAGKGNTVSVTDAGQQFLRDFGDCG